MSLLTRLASMLLDHAIMSFVGSVISIPLFFLASFIKDHYNTDFIFYLAGSILIFLYFNKDFFRAKSLAKRLLGLQVIDRKSEKPATAIQCFIRNLTIPLWPVEVFITLFSKQKRLGDLIAGTSVVSAETEPLNDIFKEIKTLFK